MYVATRGLYKMKPPTIIVPTSIKECVESLFEVHRKLDSSELKHDLVGLDIGNGTTPLASITGVWFCFKFGPLSWCRGGVYY